MAVMLYRPYYNVMQLSNGFRTYDTLWCDVTEGLICDLYNHLAPNVSKVLRILNPNHTDDISQRIMEEKVVMFLEAWLASLGTLQLKDLLIFWTASNIILPGCSLNLEFNSNRGLTRRPTSMTCTNTLTLSRFYMNQQEFENDMQVIFTKEAHIFDSL